MKAPLQAPHQPPMVIKRGSVTVKVYAGQNRVGDRTYPQFSLVYYDGPERKRRRFVDFEDAKREAALIAAKLEPKRRPRQTPVIRHSSVIQV